MNFKVLIVDDQKQVGPNEFPEPALESFRLLLERAGVNAAIEDGFLNGIQTRDARVLAERVFDRIKNESILGLVVDMLWPSAQEDFGLQLLRHLFSDLGCALVKADVFVLSQVMTNKLRDDISREIEIPKSNLLNKDRNSREVVIEYFRSQFGKLK